MTNQYLETLKAVNEFIQAIYGKLPETVVASVGVHAEASCFYRFGQSQIRQATQVDQYEMVWKFRDGKKQIELKLDFEKGQQGTIAMSEAIWNSIDFLKEVPESGNLPVWNSLNSEPVIGEGILPNEDDLDKVLSAIKNFDCSGLLTTGTVTKSISNSLGQFHQFTSSSFNLNYSLYSAKQKAVKECYAGTHWRHDDFLKSLERGKKFLDIMKLESKKVLPGKYRVYFAPACLEELLFLFNWNGLSYRSLKMGTSAFLKHFQGLNQFSSHFQLTQNFKLNLTPAFNQEGEVRPSELKIIEDGKVVNWAISSHSASEFGVTSNFAPYQEYFESLEMRPGKLPADSILKELDTGLYISNLHYINWSDQMNARITGMTRFACFWVENGKIIAPIQDLRFDESLYHLFGKGLIDFTDFQEIAIDSDSYERRAIGGSKVPGALVKDFTFTL